MYSVNNIKEALAGKSTNKYLIDILPIAFNALSNNSESQAEAIRSRYSDGVVPTEEGGAAMKLSRAVKSLTDQVNIIAITAGVDADGNAKEGPGSRHAVFPVRAGEQHRQGTQILQLIWLWLLLKLKKMFEKTICMRLHCESS